MKKYILLLTCSVFTSGVAQALTVNQQLSLVKKSYIEEFQKMDTNKNGSISEDEYLKYQFENFRADIISSEGFDSLNNKPQKNDTPQKEVSLSGGMSAIEDMANFNLDDDIDFEFTDIENVDDKKITEEDFKIELDEADEQIEGLLNDLSGDVNIEETATTKEETKTSENNEQISILIEKIKTTLPKKIDEVTDWIDIKYQNDIIEYIYSANIELNKLSPNEQESLVNNIQSETCVSAFKTMCPKLKPMFIDKNIDVRINYIDKNKQDISSCEFNETTCK